jgi:uncharacterized linocin/CFP29 family protein
MRTAEQTPQKDWYGLLTNKEVRPVQGLEQNALLRKNEWESLDEAVVEVMRQRLNGVMDLMNAGLVRNEPNLGVLESQYEEMSDMTAATQNWSGKPKGEEDTPAFDLVTVPIPITHKRFSIDRRRLEASRNIGAALDTTSAETASRLVRDKLEDMLFNGSDLVLNGNSIYGYTTATNRNTVTLTTNWDLSSADILADVEKMLDAQYTDNSFGPFILYIPKNWWATLQGDYNDNKGDRTYLERIEAYSEIQAVRPADVLTDDNAVMVQMTSDVVDLAVITSEPQVIQWESGDMWTTYFQVFSALAPRIKNDYDGRSGICHLS